MADRTGQRLDNYRLIRLLGEGSFGQVYLAEHIYRETQVAVKVLPQLAEDDLADFLNEARTIRLRHPHIVPVLDFGVANRIPFIVMEYIYNGTLRQRYPKGSRLPLDLIVLYIKQVSDALQYAHDEKLIHRDIKPENMLLRSDNDVLLSDFGIATFARSSGSHSILGMAGTITYMAPEQIQGRPVLASDQYALGVVAYEWLCGERPFKGSPMEIATQHMLKPIPSLCEKVPNLPSSVEQVVLTALEKEPKKRFPSVQAFAHELEQATRIEPPRYVAPQPVQPPTPMPKKTFSVEELSSKVVPFSSEIPAPTSPLPVRHLPTFATPLSMPPTTPFIPGPSSSPSITKEQDRRNHGRLFYPALLLLALLMVTTLGGGLIYLLRSNESQAANQALDAAQQQLANVTSASPSTALKALATTQKTLADVQKSYQLNDAQTQRLTQLQNALVGHVQQAIAAYNQQAKISVLPCNSTSHPIDNTSSHTSPESIAFADGFMAFPFLYTLGQNTLLYQINSQYGMVSPLPPGKANPQFVSMASNGSLLFLLQKQMNGNSPPIFSLTVNQPGQQGILDVPISSAQIGANITNNGYIPVYITAWANIVYVMLSSQSDPGNARILSYVLDTKMHLSRPKETQISISAPIVSIAAFPNQLFLLLASGEMQSLILAGGSQLSTPPMPVLVQPQIMQPLATNASKYSAKSPVPTVSTSVDPNGSGSAALSIPSTSSTNPAMLTAGQINGVPHLYIGDSANHRILNLESSPTGTNGATSSVKLQLDQQYVSYSDFKQLRSLATDRQGDQLAALSQNAPSMASLVSINTGAQTKCA